MTDTDALIQAFVEETIRRKKTETAFHNVLAENKRLAARLAELEKPDKTQAAGPRAVPDPEPEETPDGERGSAS